MRIGHVIYIPRFSGAEILVCDLARAHTAVGHAVGVLSLFPIETDFAPEVARLQSAGVQWTTPPRPLKHLSRLLALRRWFADFEPDVVVAHSMIPALYARLALGQKAPTVMVLHSDNPHDFTTPFGRRLERFLSRRTAAIVSVSPRAADHYRRTVGPQPNVRVIRNGVRADVFAQAAKDRATHRQSLGLSEKDRLILQLGRIDFVKRQHLTFKAFERLSRSLADVQLWLAGPIESQAYQASLEQSLPQGSVRFLGGRSDAASLLAACDLFVMPSAHEAHSIALLEALASGASVVASKIPSFEFASGFDGVRLVDPTDAAEYAAAMAAALNAPQRYARELTAYSSDATAQEYLTLFQQLMGRGGEHRIG